MIITRRNQLLKILDESFNELEKHNAGQEDYELLKTIQSSIVTSEDCCHFLLNNSSYAAGYLQNFFHLLESFPINQDTNDFEDDYNYYDKSLNEWLELLNNFFQDKGYMGRQFENLIKSPNFYLTYLNRYTNCEGSCSYIKALNKVIIFINNTHSIRNGSNLAHEIAHATSYLEGANHGLTLFTELESIFIELLSYDYLGKVDFKDSLLSKKILFLENYAMAEEILSEYKDGAFGTNICDFSQIFRSQLYEDMGYILSYLYALKLLNVYYQNQKEALKILHHIIFLRTNEEIMNYFKEVGIINLDTSNYKKSLGL